MISAGRFFRLTFGMCSPKTDSCLVASSIGGSLSFLVPSSSAPSWPTGPATLFLYQFALLTTHLPLSLVFFWPAILTPRYPVSGAPLPLRHVFFWPAILTPRYPLFRYPSPATSSSDRLCECHVSGFFGALLPLRHDSSDRLFWCPGLPFSVPQGLLFAPCFWCPWSSFSTPSFFPTHPSLPGCLGGRLALCAALRYAGGFYRSTFAGFYRSAFAGFLGALLFHRPHTYYPPVFAHFRAHPGVPARP